MFEIQSFLLELAQQRPVFHSEADFQHAFAWQLHVRFPDAKIRLEYPFQAEKWIYVDIWAEIDEQVMAIELKYKTALVERVIYNNEVFHLKNQGAQDTGRYDFVKDIQRLERVVLNRGAAIGYAVMLTNDPLYWTPTQRETMDLFFRLHDGQTLSGTMLWSEQASPGTTIGRSDPLELVHTYPLRWQQYSLLNVSRGDFRYLAIEVRSQSVR